MEGYREEKAATIDFIVTFKLLWVKRYFIASFCALSILAIILHQLFIASVVFRSEATILPIKSNSRNNMLTHLGGLASLVGFDAPKNENTAELILNSRTFAEDLVDRFSLNKRWKCSVQDAVKGVREAMTVEVSKTSSLIVIGWEDESPTFAAEVVSEILKMTMDRIAKHSMNKKILQVEFLEKRVQESERELISSEDALKNFQLKYQGVDIELQAEALISQIQLLKNEQQEKEIELQVSRRLLRPDSKEVRFLEISMEEINKKIEALIGRDVGMANGVRIESDERSLMDIPIIGTEYARKLRQVKLNQKIYGVLLEQYELAKIEAQKELEGFEIIDSPIVPEKRLRPKRTKAVVFGALVSFCLSVLIVMSLDYISKEKENWANVDGKADASQ